MEAVGITIDKSASRFRKCKDYDGTTRRDAAQHMSHVGGALFLVVVFKAYEYRRREHIQTHSDTCKSARARQSSLLTYHH